MFAVVKNALLTHHCEGVCPHDSCFLGILRGFRNGVFYGCKVRFPHAFVMTMIFSNRDMRANIKYILTATFQHARNLGLYVALYKTVACLMRHITKKESGVNSIVGGAVSGLVMFGENNPINSQINMYVFSRIFFGSVRAIVNAGWVQSSPYAYPAFASATWALVMYLFNHQQGTLQKSLSNSMTYLYNDSNTWPSGDNNILQWFWQNK